MARQTKESCKYCGFNVLSANNEENGVVILEIHPGKCISAHAYLRGADEETHEASMSIPMNYCPACGRKLEM